MKSASQILNYIINNQDNYEQCLEEIETQLQLARLQGITTFDKDATRRGQGRDNIQPNNATRTIHSNQSERTFDTT